MPDRYLEGNRFLFLESSLGPNELLLESFTGTEAISQLFSFQLELLSENAKIRFDQVLGREILFGVAPPDGQDKRYIHGVVTSFSQLPPLHRLSRYRAEVSPKLWILTRRIRSRIFQNKTALDIIKEVLSGLDVSYETQGTFTPREYCVQYRESDFNFVSRLMEEEGIYYYFKHSASGHKLVLADKSQANADVPGESEFVYDEVRGGVRDEPRIFDWEKTQHWGSGKNTLRDYFYETPKTNLTAGELILDSTQVGKVTHKLKVGGNDQFEVYDYPGRYAKLADGTRAVKLGLEQMESAQFLIRGQSNAFALVSGHRFALARHFNADGQYILTSVTHSASEGGFHADGEEASEDRYSNMFTCTPAALHFRPERVSARPFVHGCQTAVVVGPSGEEIYTDSYSRVKVQFHWDREGKNDADSSCWIRVASFWAGKAWGAVHIPRIGQEVIVDFLEGDPDRPIIVGSVYNAENMPPIALPGDKTQSGIKSRSSKGGGSANYNEIRFEDKKGSEQILVHAEKDLLTEVENDETRTVGHDRNTTVTNDDTTTINHDKSLTVANKRTATVGSDDSETVGGKQTITVASNQSVTIGGSVTEMIASSESHTTGSSRTVTIAASDSLTVGATLSITAAGAISITTGGAVSITASAISLNAPIVSVAGVLQCMTLIAAAGVVSPVYTPGAGNMV